ncbi:MAG TPA: hypothetical protein VHX61_14250 [Rhizomicrobium sp.]|jgi:hypothetical protein|nr:hypothetical protein [Rhizomicrobium sp.]
MHAVPVRSEESAARNSYLVPAISAVEINGISFRERDGAATSGERAIDNIGLEAAEIVPVEAA